MNEYDFHAQALKGVMGRLGKDCPTVQWDSAIYPIIPGSAIRRKDLSAGGFQMDADFRFSALVADFMGTDYIDVSTLKNDLLQSGLVYLDDEYKVISVSILPGSQQFTIDCNSLHQNA